MLDDKHIGLIESNDGPAPARCDLLVTDDPEFVQIPLRLPTRAEILVMSLLLIFLATPACYLLFLLMPQRSGNPLPTVTLVTAIWFISVMTPTAYWLFWPAGQLKPDHLLRYNKRNGTISLKGGTYLFRKEEVLYLLSVTDLRKGKRRTELQILASTTSHLERICLFDCQATDPFEGFGAIVTRFHTLTGLPGLFATIQLDNTITKSVL